ncbi:MAG: hypothetical protein AAF352_09250, partial [Pseudomonadota bacterium]
AQFHVEGEEDTARTWEKIPEYCEALRTALGADGAQIMRNQYDAYFIKIRTTAKQIYTNWQKMVATPTGTPDRLA